MAWYWPVAGGQPGRVTNPYGAPQTITSGYGANFGNKPKNARGQPINTGVDIPGQAGQAVLNLDDGIVEEVRRYSPQEEAAGRDSTGGYGNSIVVRLRTGQRVRYSHMQQPPPFAVGQAVQGGAQLGTVGDTGNTTGPHLDLEMQDQGGQYIDPMVVGGWQAGGATAPLPAGVMQPGSGSARQGSGGLSFADALPAGARLGVPFRAAASAIGSALRPGASVAYADELPEGAQLGVPWRQNMADGPAYPRGGPQSAYPDSGAAYPPGQQAYPPGQEAYPAPGAQSARGASPNQMTDGASAAGAPDLGPGPFPGEAPAGPAPGPVPQRPGSPTPEDIIRDEAKRRGLPPHLEDLAVAIAAWESSLDPNRPSGGNAKGTEDSWGLFQLNRGIPGKSTGAGTGYTVEELKNPQLNAKIGVNLLKTAADSKEGQRLLGLGQLGDLAQLSQRSGDANYAQRVMTTLAKIKAAGPGNAASVVGGPTGTNPAGTPTTPGEADSPEVALLTRQRTAKAAQQANVSGALDAARATVAKGQPAPAAANASQEEVNAVQAAQAAFDQATKDVVDLPKTLTALQGDLDQFDRQIQAAREKGGAAGEWDIQNIGTAAAPHYIRINKRTGERQEIEGGQTAAKPNTVESTLGPNSKYVVTINPDGSKTYTENQNYVPEKPTQLSGEGEFFTLIGPDGKVRQIPNQAYNRLDKVSDNGRTLFFDKKTGQYLGELDTKTPEERKAATDKGKAETDKAVAEAESLRVKAAADKKEAEEWQKIEEAIKAGATPAEVNTLVLQAAKSVQDYTNLLKAEQERNTLIETQRSNLAKEEVATRAQRVSEGDSALKGAESYSRYGLASAPYQTALLATQAPVTDVRKLAGSMNIDPDVTNPVAERYDRQMQQQEEIQTQRRQREEDARKPFFAPYQAQQQGAPVAEPKDQAEAQGQTAPPPQQAPAPPAAPAAPTPTLGPPTPGKTYTGNVVPGGTPEDTARAQSEAEAPPPRPEASAAGADYGAAGASAQEAPAAEGYAGMPGFQDASFKYGRDEGPGAEPIPNVPEPPGGFWDGVSPPTPEQLEYINSQRVYLSGGGGFVGGGGGLPPMYVPLQAAGGGGGGGAGGGARRPRRPVPGKHAVPLDGDWWRTEYDDGAREDWHIQDGPSWEGVGGRGSGYHGEHPPTYGIGWMEGTGGGGGSIWTLPPTPGAVPGMMGTPPMNPGGAVGGLGSTPPSPPPGGGMSGGFAGPAATGGGADPNAPTDPMAAMAGAMGAAGGAPPGGAAPQIPQDPLTYGGGAPYGGGGAGAGGGMPGMFSQAPAGSPTAPQGQAMAPMWDAASPAPFVTNGVAGPAGASGQKTLYQGGASGLPAIGGGSARGRPPSSSGSYYGGPPAPQAISPLQRLLQQSGVTPLSAGGAAGMPATI